jgi:predicted O-methyltransferase YrrM
MKEPLRMRATRRLARETFPVWQRLGLHVTASHFYEPVPDTRRLPESTWEASELVGVSMNDSAQLEFLHEIAADFGAEYREVPDSATDDATVFTLDNPSFGPVDAEVLYSMVRRLRPQRILEIGSGFTSLLIAQALRANSAAGGEACDYAAVDPYPNAVIAGGVEGLTRLLEQPVQQVALEEFLRLGEGDVLFIDSSHVLAVGSDVQYLFLEVIPRLAPGVVVHVHDIFLPREYPKAWVVDERRFWSEQYVLQAFLAFNDSWEVLWGGSHMHEHHPDELAMAFPSYDRGVLPDSLWMRRRPSAGQGEQA